jgi:hypothetical protein
MSDFGIKISKDGNDLTNNIGDLSFSTEYPPLKISQVITSSITVPASLSGFFKSAPYYHNLGFPPATLCWVDNGSYLFSLGTDWSDERQPSFGVLATNNTIQFGVEEQFSRSFDQVYTIKCLMFYEDMS